VVVSNRNAFPVTGRLGARSAKRMRVGASARRRFVRLRSKALNVGANTRKTVRLKLPRALRGVLRRKKKVSLRIQARILDPAGNRRTVTRTATPRLKVGRRARG
jgi:hypothetical protein